MFDAFPDKTFAGVVKQVRNQATTVSNVVTYDAVVAVDNPKGELRPGMTATATFVVAERRDVVVVAQKALKYRPKDAAAAWPAGRTPGQSGQSGQRGQRGQRGERGQRPDATSDPTATATAPAPAGAGKPEHRRGPGVWVLRAGAPVRVAILRWKLHRRHHRGHRR